MKKNILVLSCLFVTTSLMAAIPAESALDSIRKGLGEYTFIDGHICRYNLKPGRKGRVPSRLVLEEENNVVTLSYKYEGVVKGPKITFEKGDDKCPIKITRTYPLFTWNNSTTCGRLTDGDGDGSFAILYGVDDKSMKYTGVDTGKEKLSGQKMRWLERKVTIDALIEEAQVLRNLNLSPDWDALDAASRDITLWFFPNKGIQAVFRVTTTQATKTRPAAKFLARAAFAYEAAQDTADLTSRIEKSKAKFAGKQAKAWQSSDLTLAQATELYETAGNPKVGGFLALNEAPDTLPDGSFFVNQLGRRARPSIDLGLADDELLMLLVAPELLVVREFAGPGVFDQKKNAGSTKAKQAVIKNIHKLTWEGTCE